MDQVKVTDSIFKQLTIKKKGINPFKTDNFTVDVPFYVPQSWNLLKHETFFVKNIFSILNIYQIKIFNLASKIYWFENNFNFSL